ncbi:hypothetical protein LZK80_17340 [Rhizobium leguminosarum]|nr:hypothetical protein LZK80_17340 [Rhizobium leguminosarum]
MSQLAAKYHWEKVPSEQPVQVKLTGKDCTLILTLLNTAVGSWELHNLPEFLRDKLKPPTSTPQQSTLAVFQERKSTLHTLPASPPSSWSSTTVSSTRHM